MLIGGALVGAWAEAEARNEKFQPQLLGGEGLYNARSRDSLYAIAGRLGQRWEYLARLNELQPPFALSVGQKLQINNRHIVPSSAPADGLLLNLPGHMLYLFHNGNLVKRFPVAIGRPDWPTPEGNFTLVGKQKNPVWTVPRSIQEELRKEGKLVMEKVPPGPDNPLGNYWLPLSAPGYGIQSTIWPESIGHSTSHGCIRMLPEDIADLFPLVQSGTPVAIVYEPIKLAAADGRVYLEVHPNVYQNRPVYQERLEALVKRFGLSDQVDWTRAAAVLAEQAGVAEDISRGEAGNGKRALK
jgi:L,D-transpeptidase ErfK/SrfK